MEFVVAVAAACGLGEGVQPAFGAINDREADINASFDKLGGDKDDGKAFPPQPFRPRQDEHDMPRAHPGGQVECVYVRGELLMERPSGLGCVQYEQASLGGMVENVRNKGRIVERPELVRGDPFESFKKRNLVADDFGDFFRRDSDVKTITLFESGLCGGAKHDA